MNVWSDEINDYILDHISPEPPLLSALTRRTHLQTLKPRMLSGHLEGRVLKMLCRLSCARRVLEVGTFTGYSALCMAEALPADGELHTCEINDELEPLLSDVFASAGPLGSLIHLHIGSSEHILPSLAAQGPFDFCFLDGNKRRYVEDLELVYPLMRHGSLIAADNTLWDGHVCSPQGLALKKRADECGFSSVPGKDQQTVGIINFNNLVARDPRFETVILPLRDGLSLLYVK